MWYMKFTKYGAILIFNLIAVLFSANCRLLPSQAASSLTEEEVRTMEQRATPATGVSGSEPELPRIYLDTTYKQPSGAEKPIASGADLQAALNAAKPGDVLTLAAGATFTGNFTLPVKTGAAGWIIVRSATTDSSLPRPGNRVTPEHSKLMPRIITPNGDPALTAGAGAHHFRFIGIEFAAAPGVKQVNSLILLGDGETSLAQLPHDLIFDRVYIHGSQTLTLRRGVTLNSASTAFIDSYIAECHENGADSQAIVGFSGPGPYKIVNNYLEGAGENMMFGGAPPEIKNVVPSDIEFRLNYCFKPLSWKRDDPSFAGRKWSVKNLFELKNAQRVLVTGNIFENNWLDAQNGFAILFTPRGHGAPWSVVQDVTFTNNILRHAAGGFNISGKDDNEPTLPTKRIRISNNLLEDVNGARWSNGTGRAFQMVLGPSFLTIENNTIFQSNHIAVLDEPPPGEHFVFQNNIIAKNEYGFFGSGVGEGIEALEKYFPGYVFRRNVIVGGSSKIYPQDNFFPGSFDEVKFVDQKGGNYRLAPNSPFKDKSTAGKNIGCDFTLLEAALSGKAGSEVR